MKMNWDIFDELYNKWYDYYYTHRDKRERYDTSVFDYMMPKSSTYKKLVQEYVKIREDYLSSDRECASFERALQDYFDNYDNSLRFYTTKYDFNKGGFSVDVKDNIDNIAENINVKKNTYLYYIN